MRNIRLIVAYDGTDLAGYQKQSADKGITVQGALEKALSIICAEPIQIYGASRTDAGVHARFQVCAFRTSGSIPVENIPRATIAHLPKDIVVTEAIEIPLDWKPRNNIFGKEYIYSIYNREIADPIGQRYHWHVKKPLDIEAMRRAGKALEGTHDFSTLKGANTTPVDPVKTIYAVGIVEKNGHIDISVVGDGFLYHMVRNIAGLLVDVGLGRKSVARIPELLAAKDRKKIGKTAPAQGLVLEEIFFTPDRLNTVIQRIKGE